MTSVEPAPIKAAPPEHDVKAIPLEARKPQDRPAEVCAFQAGKRHSQVPEDVPTTVTILHLGRNRFKAFPSEVLSFQRLTHLNLYRNAIREVPGQLNTFCPNLKFLNVASNKLKECPAGLGGLPLEQLDLSGNRIRLLRENVAFLKELKELFICHNKLSYLPKEIGDLENLETRFARLRPDTSAHSSLQGTID